MSHFVVKIDARHCCVDTDDQVRLSGTDDVKKVFSLLEKHREDTRVIAGGTSLLIMMRQRLLIPKVVVSLARIPKFDRITYSPKDGFRIQAGARHRDIELFTAVKKYYPLLHETFRKVAQPRTRNMGTVGGNLAAGDRLTDPGASLIALDVEVTLTSSKGKRTLKVDEFFADYYQTALEPGELLTEIHVPPPPQRPGWSHINFTPRQEQSQGRGDTYHPLFQTYFPLLRMLTMEMAVGHDDSG